MITLNYLYTKLDEVNEQRVMLTNNNTRLIYLNGQRQILLDIIADYETQKTK